jgi:hypothetical protein
MQPSSILFEHVPLSVVKPTGADESDLIALWIGPQNPGNLLHLAQARLAAIPITRARHHRKCDPLIPVGQLVALDDLISQLGPANDRRPPTGLAQRSLTVIDCASSNFDTHVSPPEIHIWVMATSFFICTSLSPIRAQGEHSRMSSPSIVKSQVSEQADRRSYRWMTG